MKRHPVRTLAVVGLTGAALWALLQVGGHMMGAARWQGPELLTGIVAKAANTSPSVRRRSSSTTRASQPHQVPQARTLRWTESSPLTEGLLEAWAARPLPDWEGAGKVTAPRVVMARLALGQELDETNAYLQAQVPWGRSGSTWKLHPEGDYDFTLAALTTILYLYGDTPDVLYPETQAHLLDTLLIEEGGTPRTGVPRTLGLVRETENHLLMTEGSRYLKNRWLMFHGSKSAHHDNRRNGMEAWMLTMLEGLAETGLYEFNSIPYMGYTLTALMNLEAFGSEEVRAAARKVLDRANWLYAVGSLDYRRYAPFRRQMKRADLTALDADYHTALVRTWMSRHPGALDVPALTEGHHHALWAALLDYQLSDETTRWILDKPSPYFVRVGHGPWASPEIYSGGPGYLLSAGGVHRGSRSMIVARPITLILGDETRDLEELLHIEDPNVPFTEWNHTGVHRDFACAAGAVHVPETWLPGALNALWTVYPVNTDLSIVVYRGPSVGIVALFHDDDASRVLAAVTAANDDPRVLTRTFQWPDGPKLTYNVHAPKDQWVMVAVGTTPLDRDFDGWPWMTMERMSE
jgi:hypothetical protein